VTNSVVVWMGVCVLVIFYNTAAVKSFLVSRVKCRDKTLTNHHLCNVHQLGKVFILEHFESRLFLLVEFGLVAHDVTKCDTLWIRLRRAVQCIKQSVLPWWFGVRVKNRNYVDFSNLTQVDDECVEHSSFTPPKVLEPDIRNRSIVYQG